MGMDDTTIDEEEHFFWNYLQRVVLRSMTAIDNDIWFHEMSRCVLPRPRFRSSLFFEIFLSNCTWFRTLQME